MLTPNDPGGTLLKGHVFVVKPSITNGVATVTVTIPGPGLGFYVPWPITSWMHNGWRVNSQGAKTCVLEFATAPTTGDELFVLLIH